MVSQHPLEQLKSYDPAIIAEYYLFRPWLTVGRSIQIVWRLGRFVLALTWDRWQGRENERMPRRAVELRQTLTELGSTFIKVGQALSTRPDLVRADFLEELIKLQDQLPPFDHATAMATIETELGRRVEEAYRHLSPQPVAAASLGQVYRAVLHTGEEVAVKVQRPNLLAALTLDLFLMRWAAKWLGVWLPLNLGHDLTLIVDEFGYKLFEEIDYLHEGRNAEQFAHNFRDNSLVKVPSIFWRYTNRRVLTLEWINGCKLTGTEFCEAYHLDRDKLIHTAVVAGLQQLLEFGFFHADPHPGNLFAMPDGRLAYIDFGMMDQLDECAKHGLVDSVIHLINKDYQSLATDFMKLGFLAEHTDIMPIIPALESVLGDIMGESVKDFNFKTITDRFSDLMFDYPFRIPAKFALIIRSLVTQEGLALSVNPEFKIVEVAYPYVARRLLQGETPELRKRLLEVLFKDGQFQWQRLENLVTIARSDESFDWFPTAQLGLQHLFSEEGGYLRHLLLMALTEGDRLHTEEVQRLWDLVKDDIPPVRLLNTALGSLAEFSIGSAAALFPSVANLSRFVS